MFSATSTLEAGLIDDGGRDGVRGCEIWTSAGDHDPDRIGRRASTSKSQWSPRKLFVAFVDLSAAHSPSNSAYGESIHMQTSYGGYAIDGIVAGKMSRRTNAG